MNNRKDLEERLAKQSAIPEIIASIVETTNSMINLEILEGDVVTFTEVIREALSDELFAKLETLMTDEELEEYVTVLEKHSGKFITAVEHISAVVAAQAERSDYVQM